jgi:hypothetical protein
MNREAAVTYTENVLFTLYSANSEANWNVFL